MDKVQIDDEFRKWVRILDNPISDKKILKKGITDILDLREKDLEIGLYIINEFFKDMYLSANRITELTKEPISYNQENLNFAKRYQKRIKEANKLRAKLLQSDLLKEKYAIEDDDIATRGDCLFLTEMEGHLRAYLNSSNQNV